MSKSCFIEGNTIDDVYFQLLSNLYKYGRKNKIDSGSFEGSSRLEFDYAAGTIYYPITRPLAPIFPPGIPPITTDNDIVEYFVNYIMDGKNLAKNEHYRYATWITGGEYLLPKTSIRSFDFTKIPGEKEPGIVPVDSPLLMTVPNQTEWIIKHYKEKGFGNNHCVIQVGYPESSLAYDLPYKNEMERQTSPCLRMIDTHIKDGRLHFAVVFRSWDLYAAFPTNLGGIVMLMEYMADQLGIQTGPLSFSCLKLHAYDSQIESVKARLQID
jgi:thymidylate synthase